MFALPNVQSLQIKSEHLGHGAFILQCLFDSVTTQRITVEEQEASITGTQELSSDCPMGASRRVKALNVAVC